MTTPTPVTPIDAAPEAVTDRLGAEVVDVPARLLERLAATRAAVDTGDVGPGRGRT